MISIKGLSFNYKGEKTLFTNVEFELEQGSTLAILGPNGAGKTTFIKCIMGFLSATHGNVLIDGRELHGKEFWKVVGYVPQARQSAFGFNVLEMVAMGLSASIGIGHKPKEKHYQKARLLLQELGLEHLEARSCNKLSGGQLQMVLIARALIKEPQILIMDEPESHLDLKNQMKILDIISDLNLNKNITVIINTHFPQHALKISENTLIISPKGHQFDKTGDLLTVQNIRKYFEIECQMVDLPNDDKNYRVIVPTGIETA